MLKNFISLTIVVAVVALPGTAGAPKIFGLPDAMGACTDNEAAGSYSGGSLSVTAFDFKDDELLAQVELTATCLVDGIDPTTAAQTESSGVVSAALLESDRRRALFSLLGSLEARPDQDGKPTMTFGVDASLEIEGEKSANAVVKRLARHPDMSAEDLATLLNRYLSKK